MAAPLLCVMGPTASGKTNLAIGLANALGGELISVDSALVYRGLDIGSAKPTYPHHLIDICDAAEVYSAARFAGDARDAIAAVESRGRRPILVGGSMLYYRALLDGLAPMPAADAALRAQLEARAAEEGWPALHRELSLIDPRAAERIHPNHSQRILRALEVCLLSDRSLTEMHAEAATPLQRSSVCIALAPTDRAILHRRIEQRLHTMLDAGFLDEVRGLYARGDLDSTLPAIRSVGYRQLWEHLEGRHDFDTAVRKALAATRQLAKRQFTWLRKWPGLQWLLTKEDGTVVRTAGDWGAFGGDPTSLTGDPVDVLTRYVRVAAL